jgi:hypothetical protein
VPSRDPEQVDREVVRSILEMTAATRGPICAVQAD